MTNVSSYITTNISFDVKHTSCNLTNTSCNVTNIKVQSHRASEGVLDQGQGIPGREFSNKGFTCVLASPRT